jgi:hypothetical protein
MSSSLSASIRQICIVQESYDCTVLLDRGRSCSKNESNGTSAIRERTFVGETDAPISAVLEKAFRGIRAVQHDDDLNGNLE